MAADTRNATRREYWIDIGAHADQGDVYFTKKYDDLTHVREVLLGEITITREELVSAIRSALLESNDPSWENFAGDVIYHLFPEGTRDER